MTVNKNDVVYLVSRAKKNSQYIQVRNFCRERSGLVPTRILKKLSNEEKKEEKERKNSNSSDSNSKVRRSASFG